MPHEGGHKKHGRLPVAALLDVDHKTQQAADCGLCWQLETVYRAPELVPSSPAEPEDIGQDAGSGKPTKVPILPTDLVERVQHLQVLQAAGVPSDAVLALTFY